MALSGTISKTWNTGWTYKISWSATQSIANNTSTITCKHSLIQSSGYSLNIGTRSNTCTVDGASKTFTSPAINQSGGTISLGTTTHTVTHNSDGTKTCTITGVFKMQATISGTYNESITASGSITLNTIARKSSLTVVNGNLNVSHDLTIVRKSSNFKHSVKYVCGNETGYIKSDGTLSSTESIFGTTTSIKFTPPLAWANQQPNANNAVVVFTLTTYNGSTSIGTYTSAKVYFYIPDDIHPTIQNLSVSDSTGFADTYGQYIQGFSKAMVAISTSSSNAYGATVTKFSTTLEGVAYDSSNFVSNAVKGFGELTVVTTITDSRGRTDSKSTTINVFPYARPTITSANVKRTDANMNSSASGAYLTVTFNASATQLPSNNNLVYSVKYRETDGSWEDGIVDIGNDPYNVSGAKCVFAAKTSSTYDVVISVSDPIVGESGKASKTLFGPTTSVFFSQRSGGTGAAFGKVAQKEYGLELDWDLYTHKNVYDKFETLIGNGLAAYKTADEGGIDPDTTLEALCLTNINTPMGTGHFMYIETIFYGTKSATANRAQYAFPYKSIGSMYHRYYFDGAWSEWRRHVNEDEIVTPVEPADYIVERGTSGIWTYEKYNSGVAKCWGGTNVSFTGNQEWVSPWYYMTSSAVNYPTDLFTATPILTYSKTSYGALEILTISAAGSKTATPKFRIVRPSAYSSDASRTIAFHANGRWK